jgi:hypothetical protein
MEEKKGLTPNVLSTNRKARVSIGSLSQSLLNIDVTVRKQY